MPPILPERLDWSSAVGNFILNFGTLDWTLFTFLKDNLSPEDFAKIKDEHFKSRPLWVKKFLDGTPRPPEQQKAHDRLFERLEPIRELRNHIAHGHLYCQVGNDEKTPSLTLMLPKNLDEGYKLKTRKLSFDELHAALTELNALIEEFQKLAGFESEIQAI